MSEDLNRITSIDCIYASNKLYEARMSKNVYSLPNANLDHCAATLLLSCNVSKYLGKTFRGRNQHTYPGFAILGMLKDGN